VRRGGDSRGSSYARRRRKHWLLETFGDGRHCRCWDCGQKLSYRTLEADRIIPGAYGGPYRRENLRPSCRACNAAQWGLRAA